MHQISPDGTAVLCGCCPPGRKTKLAEVDAAGLEIVARSHGTHHTGTVDPPSLLRRISGTTDGSAIVEYVRRLVLR